LFFIFFFFQAEDGIRDKLVTRVQTCALPISWIPARRAAMESRRAIARVGCDFPLRSRAYRTLPDRGRRPPDRAARQRRWCLALRSEERRVGKGGDLGGRRGVKRQRWRGNDEA